MSFENVEKAIEAIKAGRMVILVDDEDRENEGDVCMAAEKVTAEDINFMATHARGLICLTLTPERLQALDIPMMVHQNTSSYQTAFTVSIEARQGVSTGISAADRAHTIQVAVADATRPEDLARPGHIFPLRACQGGTLVRTGQTEGSVDLARLAGLKPAGVICEIMNADGTMARRPALMQYAQKHNMPLVSIAELIAYRLAHETFVHRLSSHPIAHPSLGALTAHVYNTVLDDRQHLALVRGQLEPEQAPLVRVQTGYSLNAAVDELLTGDHPMLRSAAQCFSRNESAVWLCLERAAPNSTLDQRVAALAQPQTAPPASEPQQALRELGIGAQILRDLGLGSIRLLSHSTRRLVGLEAYGLTIEQIVPLQDA